MTPLRQRMLEDMGIRNLAKNTQKSYAQQIAGFANYFGRSPEELGPEQVRDYQLYLSQTRKLAPSSIGLAAGALRFLYKVTLKRGWAVEDIPMPKRPFKLPVILSPEEVMHFLESVGNLKHRTLLTASYAAGLRVSEATHLKVTDVDSERMMLRVDQGKGNKDRYVMLSPRLLEVLRLYRPHRLFLVGCGRTHGTAAALLRSCAWITSCSCGPRQKVAKGATVIRALRDLYLTVQVPVERVSSSSWNPCPGPRGITVQLSVEYAHQLGSATHRGNLAPFRDTQPRVCRTESEKTG